MYFVLPVMVIKEVGGLAEVPRLNGDHGHPEFGQLQPQDLGEAGECVLGGGIDAEAGAGVARGHGGHVDQPRPRTGLQQRQRGLR